MRCSFTKILQGMKLLLHEGEIETQAWMLINCSSGFHYVWLFNIIHVAWAAYLRKDTSATGFTKLCRAPHSSCVMHYGS